MTELEWLTGTGTDLGRRVNFMGKRVSDRKLLLLASACCRRIWPLLEDQRSRAAVAAAERYADGKLSRPALQKSAEEARRALSEMQRRLPAPQRWEERKKLDALVQAAAAASGMGSSATSAVLLAAHDSAHAVKFRSRSQGMSGRPPAKRERVAQLLLLHDIVGNPFRPVTLDPAWRTATVTAVAQIIYDQGRFADLPILADALEDAGCCNTDILSHCRSEAPHIRGCWVVDGLLDRK
jgi:hypothetical protein